MMYCSGCCCRYSCSSGACGISVVVISIVVEVLLLLVDTRLPIGIYYVAVEVLCN